MGHVPKCPQTRNVKQVCRGKPFKQNSPGKLSTSKKKGQGVHKVQNESDSDSDDTLASLELHKVAKGSTNIIWVTPEVEGKPLQTELDTGSAVSVLPLSKYNTMFKSSTPETRQPTEVLQSKTSTIRSSTKSTSRGGVDQVAK